MAHRNRQTPRHRSLPPQRRRRAQTRRARPRTRSLEQTSPDLDSPLNNPISDDLLRLAFIACHPILPTDSRVALTLRLLGGLTTDEIARALLTPELTIVQRIVRAKRTLADK